MTATELLFVPDGLGAQIASGGRVAAKSGSYIDIESGAALRLAGTAITSNASEVNSLDGVATTWSTQLSGAPTFTIGAEGSNIINVACQLKDATGTNPTSRRCVYVYLSDDAEGDGISGTALTSAMAIGTNGTIIEVMTAALSAMVTTNATGAFDLNLTYTTGAHTYYLIVVVNSVAYATTAITFAA